MIKKPAIHVMNSFESYNKLSHEEIKEHFRVYGLQQKEPSVRQIYSLEINFGENDCYHIMEKYNENCNNGDGPPSAHDMGPNYYTLNTKSKKGGFNNDTLCQSS